MSHLVEIRGRDQQLCKVTRDCHSQVAQALQGTIYETTASVLSSLVEKLEVLKRGILDLGEVDNLYSMYVLFRVFLEHLLRVQAIFLVSVRQRSDSIAVEYLRLHLAEAFAYLKAYEKAGVDSDVLPNSQLDQWFAEAGSLSAKEIQEIEAPFRYRNLISTIRQEIGVSSPDFLSKIIPNYSELSAFVHGGPSADCVLHSFKDEVTRREEIVRVADLTVYMFHSAERWLLLLGASIRREFKTLYDALDQELNHT